MVHVVTTMADLEQLAEDYSRVDSFAYDTETIGADPLDVHTNQVCWLSLATYGRADVIACGHPNGEFVRWDKPLLKTGLTRVAKGLEPRDSDYSQAESKWTPVFTDPPAQLTPQEVFSTLKPIFLGDARKVAQNSPFDVGSIRKYLGELPAPPYGDTLSVYAFLDNRHRRPAMGLREITKTMTGYDLVKGTGKDIASHGFDEVAKYALLDAKYTWLSWRALLGAVEDQKAQALFHLEMQVLGAVYEMESTGALIDQEALAKVKEQLDKDLQLAETDVYRLSGRVWNIKSNPEKQQMLFGPKETGGRGLRPTKMTEGGEKRTANGAKPQITDYSVDDSVLREHAEKDPLCKALMEYSDLSKLTGTYITPYHGGTVIRTTGGKAKEVEIPSLLKNGRIHASFKPWGAESGRFSSSNPNLQNVPSRGPHGRMIRDLFVAPEGHSLVVADYGQVEPRIIASLSGDPHMIQAFMDGEDVYMVVANRLGVDRAKGKESVLSIAYGVGVTTMAGRMGVTVKEARDVMDSFDRQFPRIGQHKAKAIQQCRLRKPVPYASTHIFKRRRYFPTMFSRDDGLRSSAERAAYNHLIQGCASDILKMALIRTQGLIPETARMVATVHDEILIEVPTPDAEETVDALREAMEQAAGRWIKVPLIADIHIGTRWGAAKSGEPG